MSDPLTVSWHHVAGRPVRSLVLGVPQRDRPQMVLVPGLGALGYLLPVVRACATWTRVHLLDVPGFGDRRTARLPADVESSARTVAAWLAQVPRSPVLLAGHSTGAQVALHAAARAPSGVAGLVLAGITFPPTGRRLPGLAGAVLRTLPHERPGELPATLPYYLRGLRRLPELLRSALQDRPEALVPVVRSPVLVLRGRHDHLCPQPWAELLVRRAHDGRLVVLPGGHNTPYTHPLATADELRREAELRGRTGR
jgi:pimeloyl-ACP methyl ester carboxylesterase